MKHNGGQKATSVVEGYIEESIENKNEIYKRIFTDLNKISDVEIKAEAKGWENGTQDFYVPEFNAEKVENCTFNIQAYVNK